MVAVHLGLDSDSCSTAFPSTGPALLLQLCCIQYISCCRTAGGCVQLSATMCVCVCVCACTFVPITFFHSSETALAVSVSTRSLNCICEEACNVFETFANTRTGLLACWICIHPDIPHTHTHVRFGNLHVIICILYKAGMSDRPPTAQ